MVCWIHDNGTEGVSAEIVPPTVTSGNITLWYPRRLTVTPVADLERCPDLGQMQTFLSEEPAVLTEETVPAGGSGP